MIRLIRPQIPEALTRDLVAELTAKYIRDGSSVWLRVIVTKPLLESSYNKCAYCETTLLPIQDMEVEHFKPKGKNPQLVMEWTNLLPSCGKCNSRKHNHDVIEEPIINPYDQDPRDHLAIRLTRFVGTTDLGRMTLDVLPLNDLANERYKIIEILDQKIEILLNDLQKFKLSSHITTSDRRRLRKNARAILRSGLPQKDYSATSAGFLQNEPDWLECIDLLNYLAIWTTEEEDLWRQAQAIGLPYRTVKQGRTI